MNTKINIYLLLGLLVALPVFSQKKELGTVNLQHTSEGRVFEGIGALSAGASSRLLADYPEKQQQDILDYLFKPKFGASLHHLKVEIGGDVNSTSGTEPSHARTREELENPHETYYLRGYEWWLMKEAKKRNPAIFLDCLEWGAPGWIGDGKFYSQDNIDYMLAFLKGAKQYHQVELDYIGIWNERMHDTEFIRNLRKALDMNGLNHVKLVCSDLCCGSQWQIADDMVEDADLFRAVDIIGDHYPEREFNYHATPNALESGKPLWNSEGGPWKGTWEGFCELAKLYNRDYIVGKMTKTITWSLITSYYDNLALPNSGLMKADSPWSGYYEVEPALWAVAHTTQFTEPGWQYLDQEGCGFLADSTVSYVTLRSPDKKDLSIIIESIDLKEPGSIRFVFPENFAGNKLSLWRSVNQKETFVKQPDIRVKNGVFTLQVEPEAIYSITTTTGQ
ncbi:MAG: hypothetical protein LIO97_10800 [Tannerellaceae bacterium]|nr:hypothetical protein [Tannerellaceae bacterium]